MWGPLVRVALRLVLVAALVGIASPSAKAFDVFTGFEEFIPNTIPGDLFDVGASPNSTTFSGNAFAGRAFQPALYHTGLRGWMVLPLSTGTVDFETPATLVDFWARTHPTATGNTVITVFDPDGNPTDGRTLAPADGWQNVVFGGPVGQITVVNEDALTINGVDDFGYDVGPPLPPCTLELTLDHTSGTLTLSFGIGLTAPASWNLFLVLGNDVLPLWKGILLPGIDPPLQLPVSFPFPQIGTIGALTTLTIPRDGIVCSDFEVVDTGQP